VTGLKPFFVFATDSRQNRTVIPEGFTIVNPLEREVSCISRAKTQNKKLVELVRDFSAIDQDLSAVQLALYGKSPSQIVTAAPPVIEIFLSLLSAFA
jgi:hypothetical protein